MRRWVSQLGAGLLLYRRPGVRHFAWHAFEMVVAMVTGMMLLGMVWTGFWPTLGEWPAADVLIMALDMTIGMGLWMWIRGHHWQMIAEMGVAMVAPFVVLLVPFSFGLLSGDGLMDIGHLAMMVAMLAVMVLRISHYAQPQRWRFSRQRKVRPSDSTPTPAA
jgi:hypothetical protein